jgi:hypothetical protein
MAAQTELVSQSATRPPLRLKGRMLGLAFAGAAALAISTCSAALSYGDLLRGSLLTTMWIGVTGLGGLSAFICGVMPIELTADDHGISWRQWFTVRSYSWAEIEEIGIGRSKAFDGWDQPAARAVIGPAPPSHLYLGVNLVPAKREAASVSYQRGFTGFDVNLTPPFKASLKQIVAELQARLETARANAVVSS